MLEHRSQRWVKFLRLGKKISFAWALTAIVSTVFVATHQLGIVLPVPFLLLLVSVGLAGGFGGLAAGSLAGAFMSFSIIYAWVLGFGPVTLTGSLLNVVLGCSVAVGFGAFLGAMRDQIVDLVVELDQKRRELDDVNRRLEQRIDQQSEALRRTNRT